MTQQPHSYIYSEWMTMCVHRNTCMQIFIAALVTIATNCKQTNCPPSSEWMNKLRCNHTRWSCPQWKRRMTDISNTRNELQKDDTRLNKPDTEGYITVCKMPFLWNSRKGKTVVKSGSLAAKSCRLVGYERRREGHLAGSRSSWYRSLEFKPRIVRRPDLKKKKRKKEKHEGTFFG